MSDPDRGAYTPPTDAPLAFDARQPVRGGGPAPIMLIISALVLIALVVAIIMFYRSGVREAGQPPRTVGEPVGEMKGAPPAEAQPANPAQGLQIYQTEEGETAPATPNFTAPPEEPQARPAPVTVQPPPRAAPSAGGPIAAAPIAPVTPALKGAVQPPAAKAPPPKTIDQALAQAPATKPAPTAASGGAAVQIGAFSSQAIADREWSAAASLAGGGKGKRIEAVDRNGSTLYRTQVTGFGSRAEASAFCDKLKASGKNCFVK